MLRGRTAGSGSIHRAPPSGRTHSDRVTYSGRAEGGRRCRSHTSTTPSSSTSRAAEPTSEDAALAEELQTVAPLYFYAFNAEAAAKILGSTTYSASAYAAQPALPSRYNVVPRLHEIRAPTLI